MDTNGMGSDAGGNPSEPSLLNELGMDTGAGSPEVSNPLLEESGAGTAASLAQAQAFKFAGKEYRDQASAEKSFKQLYGKYSESQGIINTVKKALNNPELLESLAEDPAWADIFAKLGIETDLQGTERESAGERGGPQPDQMYHEWQVEREVDRLEREEFRFERELGRPLNPEERRATLSIIKRANSLSFKEAWQLANHERLIAEARKAQGQRPAPRGNRPAPPPVNVPGTQVNSRKPVNKMSEGEWKDNLRNDPDLRELLSR